MDVASSVARLGQLVRANRGGNRTVQAHANVDERFADLEQRVASVEALEQRVASLEATRAVATRAADASTFDTGARTFILGTFFGLFFLFLTGWIYARVTHQTHGFVGELVGGAYDILPLTGSLLIVAKARRFPAISNLVTSRRRALYAFAFGMLCWSIGGIVWMLYNFLGKDIPFPSLADAFYYPNHWFWVVGLFYFYISLRQNIHQNIGPLFGVLAGVWGITVTTLLFFYSKYGLDDPVELALDILYPCTVAVSIVLVLTLVIGPSFTNFSRSLKAGLVVILAGLMAHYGADFTFAVATMVGDHQPLAKYAYFNGGPTDFVYAVAFTALIVGVLTLPMQDEERPAA